MSSGFGRWHNGVPLVGSGRGDFSLWTAEGVPFISLGATGGGVHSYSVAIGSGRVVGTAFGISVSYGLGLGTGVLSGLIPPPPTTMAAKRVSSGAPSARSPTTGFKRASGFEPTVRQPF
jgi:hypothetical protein